MPKIVIRNHPSEIKFSCYPNPFNNITNINYSLPEDANVELDLYNILGEKIACLTKERQNAGNYVLQFDGSKLKQGIFYCRLEAHNDNFIYSKINILMIVR